MGHDIYVYEEELKPVDDHVSESGDYSSDEEVVCLLRYRGILLPLDIENHSRAIYEILQCPEHDGGCSGIGTGQYFKYNDIFEAIYKLRNKGYLTIEEDYFGTKVEEHEKHIIDLIKFLTDIICIMIDKKLDKIYIMFG